MDVLSDYSTFLWISVVLLLVIRTSSNCFRTGRYLARKSERGG